MQSKNNFKKTIVLIFAFFVNFLFKKASLKTLTKKIFNYYSFIVYWFNIIKTKFFLTFILKIQVSFVNQIQKTFKKEIEEL